MKTLELRSLLHRSVSDHVHRAEQAFALAEEIGNHAWTINRHGFGPLFYILQVSLSDELTLSLTKLLESPDHRHPRRRSIPVVLTYLEQNADDLPIQNRACLEQILADERIADLSTVKAFGQNEVTLKVAEYFRSTLPKPRAFWFRRDKRVAHTEAVETPGGLEATWNEGRRLIQYAQHFAAVIGDAYGVFHFEAADGTYMLSKGAEEAARMMRRLLGCADLLDIRRGQRPRIEHEDFVAEADEEAGVWVARVIDTEENIVAVGSTFDDVQQKIIDEIQEHLVACGKSDNNPEDL